MNTDATTNATAPTLVFLTADAAARLEAHRRQCEEFCGEPFTLSDALDNLLADSAVLEQAMTDDHQAVFQAMRAVAARTIASQAQARASKA